MKPTFEYELSAADLRRLGFFAPDGTCVGRRNSDETITIRYERGSEQTFTKTVAGQRWVRIG